MVDETDIVAFVEGRTDTNKVPNEILDVVKEKMVIRGFKFQEGIPNFPVSLPSEEALSSINDVQTQYLATKIGRIINTPFLEYPEGVSTTGNDIDRFDENMRSSLTDPKELQAYDWLKERNRWKVSPLMEIQVNILILSENIIEHDPDGAMNLQLIATSLTQLSPEPISMAEMRTIKEDIVSREEMKGKTNEEITTAVEDEYQKRAKAEHYYKYLTKEEKLAIQKQYAKAAELALCIVVGKSVSEDDIAEVANMSIPVGKEREQLLLSKNRYEQIKANSSI